MAKIKILKIVFIIAIILFGVRQWLRINNLENEIRQDPDTLARVARNLGGTVSQRVEHKYRFERDGASPLAVRRDNRRSLPVGEQRAG